MIIMNNNSSLMNLADKLAAIPGTGFAVDCIRQSAHSNTMGVIDMIKQQPRESMFRVLGEELLKEIELIDIRQLANLPQPN